MDATDPMENDRNVTSQSGHSPVTPAVAGSPVLLEGLVRGRDYVVFLDADLRITSANEAFAGDLFPGWKACPTCFLDTLVDASRDELRSRYAAGVLGRGESLQLQHVAPGGPRSVCYVFRRCGELWVAMGRDASEHTEVCARVELLLEKLGPTLDRSSAPAGGSGAVKDRDVLTGLPSNKDLEQVLRARQEQSILEGRGYAVVCLDIDRFREINDFYGHPVGDMVLQKVASVISESVRPSDVVARAGGEEFVVVCPDLDIRQAMDLAERLRAAVERAKMPESVRKVSVSVGVAVAGEGVERNVLHLAERALAKAKECGRNCVRCAE